MLVQTDDGVLNTDHVVSVSETPGNPHRCSVTLSNGEVRIVGVFFPSFGTACGVIVPAQPGFTVITAILPDNSEEGIVYGEEPVIAFRVGHGGMHDGPIPITVSGEPSTIGGDTIWITRQPNGACFGPDHLHDDLDDFKAACERIALARLAAA